MLARLYRLSLLLLPRSFRERNGPDMELVFRESLEGASGAGERFVISIGSLLDVLRVGAALRRSGRPRQRENRRRRSRVLESIWIDVKFALRSLRRRAAFAGLAVVTLAVGIGAVTSIFSVVNGVLLRPLAYAGSERIAIIWHDLGNGAQSLPALHPLDFYDYRERSELFEGWTIATGRERILGELDNAELVDVGHVDENFFSFFGVEMLLGRAFRHDEAAPGGADVAVLSYRLWERRFGTDPGVLGRTIRLAGAEHEIVGILPASFRLHLPAEAFRLRDAEIWAPVQIDRDELPPRNYTGYTAFGRIEPSASFTIRPCSPHTSSPACSTPRGGSPRRSSCAAQR